jgi:hypothetical protein
MTKLVVSITLIAKDLWIITTSECPSECAKTTGFPGWGALFPPKEGVGVESQKWQKALETHGLI